MEYPMITCIGGQRDTLALYSVLVHETGHMWFPMMVGSNETRFAWQDEGLTRFNQSEGMKEFFPGYDRWAQSWSSYRAVARAGQEVELMRHGNLYPRGSPAYSIASYEKMSLILRALRGLLGEETFLRAYREYGRRWWDRHPTPFDFFNTFGEFAGAAGARVPAAGSSAGGSLWWFWRTWFYETWTLDQAVTGVTEAGGQAAIAIADRGLAPMPVRIVITREGGATERVEIPVDVWLEGARTHSALVPSAPRIVRVEIDPEHWFPDIERGNNVWTR
jgi:aminopeptidase N